LRRQLSLALPLADARYDVVIIATMAQTLSTPDGEIFSESVVKHWTVNPERSDLFVGEPPDPG
jgi:hypothetical protein